MNIVIVGVGNIGFEVTKLLSENDNVIIIARNYPQYLEEYCRTRKNIHFIAGDATRVEDISKISSSKLVLELSGIDVLICSVGANSSSSAIQDHQGYKDCFEKNYYANLIPIQLFFSHLQKRKGSKYILISASSGHHADKRLTGYPASKWALENTFSALREEMETFGISVDVLVIPTLKNKFSKVWQQDRGISPQIVANRIIKLIHKSSNSRLFIPKRYFALRLFERLMPKLLDRYHGLFSFSKRKKIYRNLSTNSVVITGAAQGLGEELAKVYSAKAKEIYLIDKDIEKLKSLKVTILQTLAAKVTILEADLRSEAQINSVIEKIGHIDLLINNAGVGYSHPIVSTPVDIFKECFSINLFASTYLTSILFQRELPPRKVINILSTTAIKGRLNFGIYSSAKSALWNFSRSMRRLYGNTTQILEVIPSRMANTNYFNNINAQYKINKGQPNVNQNEKIKLRKRIKFLKVSNWTAKDAAERIEIFERKGREILMIPPFKARLFLIFETIASSVFSRIF